MQVGKSMDSGASRQWIQSQECHLIAMLPCASRLTLLCLGFLICKTEIIIVPDSWRLREG